MVKYVVFRLVLQWFWAHITILVPRFLNWEKNSNPISFPQTVTEY